MVGGWADAYRSTVLRVLEGYDGPCKGLIGPWSHHYGFNGLPGPSIGFLQEALRWWDHWLKGAPDGVHGGARAARLDAGVGARRLRPGGDRPGRWVAEPEWPPARPRAGRSALAPGALGEERAAARRVGLDRGHARVRHRRRRLARLRAPRRRRRSSSAPRTGARSSSTRSRSPRRSRSSASRARGSPSAPISRRRCVAVRLCDVAPDGTSTLVTRGVLNLTHRDEPRDARAARAGRDGRRHGRAQRDRARLPARRTASGSPSRPPTGRGRGRRPPRRS